MELRIQGMDLQRFGLTLKAIKTKKGLEKTIYVFSSPNITGGVNKFLQVRIWKYIWIICDFMT